MPVSKNEILEIQANIHHCMSTGEIDQVIERATNTLDTYRTLLDAGIKPDTSDKEFEIAIEILVQYEGIKNNLGIFKKVKLRTKLILKYS